MLKKVLDYITSNKMIVQGDRVVVGVSGGADSVCLLYALLKLYREKGVTFIAVHVNHGIRGEEAERDEQFVKELCMSNKIEYYSFFADVLKLAAEQGLSEEEAGRKVRYDAFLEISKLKKCNKIAVAHNKNDNAETVLFHLFRGTGMKGLSGIEPSRSISMDYGEITLIRPLLCVERFEIEEFLKSEGVSFQIDSTNLTEDYSRNKIRNRILKYATEEINSGAIGNINETAIKIKEASEYIDSQVMKRYLELVRYENNKYSFVIRDFAKEPIILQKGILRKILEGLAGQLKDLESKHVDAVLSLVEKQVGRQVHLPYGILAERGYDDIKLYCPKDTDVDVDLLESIKVLIPGRTVVPQKRTIFDTELMKYEKNEPIPKSSCVKWFDYDKIENTVEIRSRREGDYFQINVSGGRKKLKDYFIDAKIPRKQRDSQILITDGSHVMWIPGDGERISEKYKVGPSTTSVLLMKMIDLEENEDDK